VACDAPTPAWVRGVAKSRVGMDSRQPAGGSKRTVGSGEWDLALAARWMLAGGGWVGVGVGWEQLEAWSWPSGSLGAVQDYWMPWVRVIVAIYTSLVGLDVGPQVELDLAFWAFAFTFCTVPISGAGMRVSGMGTGGTSPNPLDPMGRDFSPLVSPWGVNLSHPQSPVEDFSAENRVSGPHCHLYSYGSDW